MAVANNISGNRAKMQSNDIIPWLSTATYGEFDPVRTRDMILEAFANGARGITYYWYGDFDAAHFRYHAEAIDLVSPIEDVFVDGKPLAGLKADNAKVKICGMGLGDEKAVLLSNYQGVPAGAAVNVTVPVAQPTPVWDLHTGKRVGEMKPGGALRVTLDGPGAHLFYVGTKYAARIAE